MEIIVGTRGSALARWQTGWVVDRLARFNPHLSFRLQEIRTRGDRIQDVPLAHIGGKGIFVREIEIALLQGEIHLAVHSLKDMPTEQPPGLVIAAVTERADPRDVLVSRLGVGLAALPSGARIGTSSLRRKALLLAFRSDFQIIDLRGNVDTRLRKAEAEPYDAVVLAAAGLLRLDCNDRVTEYIAPEVLLPAVGQGAMAVEIRADDGQTAELVMSLNDPATEAATVAERAFLRHLGGGCQVPIAAFGEVASNELRLRGLVASPDGQRIIHGAESGPVIKAETVGKRLAEELLKRGARALLDAL